MDKPWTVGRSKAGKDAVWNSLWWDEFRAWRAQMYENMGQAKAEMVVGEVERWCGEENT